MAEIIVPGCQLFNSMTGICEIMFQDSSTVVPSQAVEARIPSPVELEGPGLAETLGLLCMAHASPDQQTLCSNFAPRLSTKDQQDENV